MKRTSFFTMIMAIAIFLTSCATSGSSTGSTYISTPEGLRAFHEKYADSKIRITYDENNMGDLDFVLSKPIEFKSSLFLTTDHEIVNGKDYVVPSKANEFKKLPNTLKGRIVDPTGDDITRDDAGKITNIKITFDWKEKGIKYVIRFDRVTNGTDFAISQDPAVITYDGKTYEDAEPLGTTWLMYYLIFSKAPSN